MIAGLAYHANQLILFAKYNEILMSYFVKMASSLCNTFSLQSYAGKYVPAVSYYIHKNNPTAKVKINFKGMAIGDGLCDPELVRM